jgi:imidazolonepropionase
MKIIFPFKQILTLRNLNLRGCLSDDDLQVITDAAICLKDNKIYKIGKAKDLLKIAKEQNIPCIEITENKVLTPAFVDCHTHICYAGSRAGDFAKRLSGKTYLEIAKEGGGILYSVEQTRKATLQELEKSLIKRALQHAKEGVLTCEVKSGYGLNLQDEIKMLQAIKNANEVNFIDLIPTCLAAHTIPIEYKGKPKEYLAMIVKELFPILKKENLTNRIDVFVEDSAFNKQDSKEYLQKAKDFGFDITLHADQFHAEGSILAVEMNAISADHLEASTENEIKLLGDSNTVATALPGACIGLGIKMPPARKLLDANAILAIATDWNPGSAPMGNLLAQASILATYEKLSFAEVWAGITFRAAKALNIQDKGRLEENFVADMLAFETDDYREIIYSQGRLKPSNIWKNGIEI